MVPKSVKKNELYFKHDNIAVPPTLRASATPIKKQFQRKFDKLESCWSQAETRPQPKTNDLV